MVDGGPAGPVHQDSGYAGRAARYHAGHRGGDRRRRHAATLSLQRYGEVIDAYPAGVEQARTAGCDPSEIHSVASFFASRIDAEVDSRLDKLGTPEAVALGGKAAIANARPAYELSE